MVLYDPLLDPALLKNISSRHIIYKVDLQYPNFSPLFEKGEPNKNMIILRAALVDMDTLLEC